MAQYLITYLGGKPPKTQEEGQQHFEQYRQWLMMLGDALVSPANPLKNTCTIRPDGSVLEESTTAMSGYSILQADSMEQARVLVKGCPFLDIGGSLEVSELVQTP